MHRGEWSASALEDIDALFDHLAEQAALRYGEGVRRISRDLSHS